MDEIPFVLVTAAKDEKYFSKHSSNTLLSLLQFFMRQTLCNAFFPGTKTLVMQGIGMFKNFTLKLHFIANFDSTLGQN